MADSVKTSAETPLPRPGSVIRGKYRLVRLIGEGGMGVVFEAEHVRLNQRVAIKVLQPARSGRRDAARFMREARAASQLGSHHVARVLDVDELETGLPFMVMEYLDGCDLEHELANRGRLLICEAVDYVIQACEAVAEAHAKGIVHRDLKPSNLFLCDLGEERVVKVLDFGISKMADEASVTLTATSLGTPLYMSPEQIRDAKEVDHRSDIWSLGVILFELLAGQPPFEGKGGATAVSVAIAMDPPPWLRTLRTDIPQELEQVVVTMLEKDRDVRYHSVADVAEALRPFASDPALPGHVRISQLPRVLSSRPSARMKQTASTVSSSRVHSAWTTDSRSPRRTRFIYYAIGAAAFVLGGGFSAAVLGPALLRPVSGGPPASVMSSVRGATPAGSVSARMVKEAVPSATSAEPRMAGNPPSSPRPASRASALPERPSDVSSPTQRVPVPNSPAEGPRSSPTKNPIRL
jgi:serine/threonine-protein kinase